MNGSWLKVLDLLGVTLPESLFVCQCQHAEASLTSSSQELCSYRQRWTSHLRSNRNKAKGCYIFPFWAFFALWSAFPMGNVLPRLYICNLNRAALAPPQKWVCLIPVVTPTLLTDSCTPGPFQTLIESLNQFISLGGNNQNNRLKASPGSERSKSQASASTSMDI